MSATQRPRVCGGAAMKNRSYFKHRIDMPVNVDAKHKLIRHYAVSDAAVHDSQKLDGLLDKGNTCNDVFAAKECRPPCLA
jgi:IS5 family transposase